MAQHPNVALIKRGFDAFNAADMAGLAELLDENASQHMAGANQVFSGDHHGRDNLFAMYGRLGEASGGTFRAELEHVWANDDTAVAVYRDVADDLAVVDDREVADPAVGHHRHALVDRRLGRDDDQGRGHDLADRGLLVRLAFQRDAPEIVALGHDPDDLIVVRDEQRADI